MQNRYKSKVVWMSIFSLLLLILKNYNLLDNLGLNESSYNEITTSILSILVLFGVLNNPTKTDRF